MPLHAVTYVYPDRPDELAAVRPEHRAFLRDLHEAGVLLASGPLPATPQEPPGALIVLDVPSPEEAATVLDADPFARAGLIAHRSVRPWSPVIGEWAHRA